MHYPVNEIFCSIQGEGALAGQPAVFIRLQGCAVGCAWCDTKHTWATPGATLTLEDILLKDEPSPLYAEVDHLDLVHCVMEMYGCKSLVERLVVITGGEPCQHDLFPLCSALLDVGFRVQVETSGTYATVLPDSVFLTVSPKIGMPGGRALCQETVQRAHEIKHVIGRQRDVDIFWSEVAPLAQPQQFVFVQPMSQSKTATKLCVDFAKCHNVNLSLQMHKYIGIR